MSNMTDQMIGKHRCVNVWDYRKMCHRFHDLGMNPHSMRGSKTGVFVGASGSETGAVMTTDAEKISGYSLTGCVRSMFANRLSFALDFQGPSFAVDTACSSSLLALQLALDAIRTGQCDAALVAGSHLTLSPTTAIQFLRLNMLTPDGACKSFDAAGNGYARSEGVGCILLQKSCVAKRVYATVVHAKSNTDGYKEHGITFPSGNRQAELLESVYREAGVDPGSVSYVECHGTGTKVGDPQEAQAITDVFCQNRVEPLLIGSVKSSMGHCEPASGLASVAKVLIAMEKGFIPPNLHFKEPNPHIPSLFDGRLKVVSEKTRWDGGLVGVNSFGFGGSNTHILLRSHPRQIHDDKITLPDIPSMICVPGRTSEAVDTLINAIETNQNNPHFLSLLAEQANAPTNQFPYRGYSMFKRDYQEPLRDVQKVTANEKVPVYFIYSGMGSQWAGMAQDLMRIETFRQSVQKCSEALKSHGVNPYALLMKGEENDLKDTMHSMVCITTVQLALTDLLRKVGIEPDGIIGHSTGEMACAYADGAMNREETMLCIYHRGKAVSNARLPPGAMAAVGLTWEEAEKRIPEGVVRACHNGKNSVTISGDVDKVEKIVEELEQEGVFAKMVNSGGVAFHSHMMKAVEQDMLRRFRKVLPNPKKRTPRWVSSSIAEERWEEDLASTCSAEYQVNNALSPVLFYEAIQKIPANATTIEIAPHSLMQAILRRNLPNTIKNVGLMKARHENNLEFVLQALGKIYQTGVSVQLQKIYPRVLYPVPSGTPMIAPLMRWDHSQAFHVVSAKDINSAGGGVAASTSYAIDPFASDSKDQYLLEHVIDGRTLFPFTGHVVLAWKALCKLHQIDYQKTPVIFEDVNVFRPTIMSKAVKLDVIVSPGGKFEIMEGDSMAANGKITVVEEPDTPFFYSRVDEDSPPEKTCEKVELKSQDIYKEFLLRGYEYGPHFRGIYKTCNSGDRGQLYWTGNWVTFLDSLLQTALLSERADTLRLPVRLRYLRIDPQRHFQSVKEEGGLQLIDLRNDAHTRGCIAGGIEVCELTASTVPRRLHASGHVYLEKVVFVKDHDDNCLDGMPSFRADLKKYSGLCRSVLASGLAKWKLQSVRDDAVCALLHKISKSIGTGSKVDEAYKIDCLEDKKNTLLRLLEEIFSVEKNGTQASALVSKIRTTVREQLGTLQLDKYWMSSLSQRAVKPLLDTTMENIAGHYIPCIMVEPRGTSLPAYIRDFLHTHPLLVTDWNLVGPSLETLSQDDIANEGFGTEKLNIDRGDDPPETLKNTPLLVMERVLSKKSDISGYLTNLKKLLRDDGFVLVEEVTEEFELAGVIEALIADAESIPSDNNRKFGFFLSHKDWMKIFTDNGFNVVGYQRDPASPCTLYLLHKIPDVPRDPVFVAIDDVKDFSWITPLQEVIEERLKEPEEKTIWLMNTETRDNGTIGLGLCLREESALANRYRMIQDCSLNEKTPRLTVDHPEVKRIIKEDLHTNNYRDGEWGSYRHLIVADDEVHEYQETEHAFVNTLVRGDLSSLCWVESPNQFFLENPRRLPTQKLCAVYYTAVNFRDIMLASVIVQKKFLGRLPPDAIPGQFADRECLLGMEYAGRLMETGRRVMGILPAQALATTLVCDINYCWTVPDHWTMKEAATVPVIYCTAYYALMVRGNMKKGDKVLIHSGSGGVGQAAIAIALHHGCEVFTTVSNTEKKEFLQQKFPQLQDRHFSNSRTTDFEWHIKHQTKGKGVEIVLNSLSEDKLQASLRCLGQHGRFLEIGKFDLSNNSPLGMAVFLKNVTFHGILLDALMDDSANDEWVRVGALLTKGIEDGVVKPVHSTVFDRESIEPAFRFMAQGKHIGKVIIQVRDEDQGTSTLPPSVKVNAVRRAICHPQHVYLITGGLGGFGLELAQWLINRGARKLVLTSRRGIKTGYQARSVYFWRRTGISVLVSTTNITEEADAEKLITECQEMGPLGGVFHLAMILRDCLFENQSAQNFKDTAESKYYGTLSLDKATRKLCGPELRWFVGFSSITSGRGNAGQTNYGWANSTMERIIEKRHADGKGGVVIQWGAIGDVGVILENMGDNFTVVGGTLPQRMPSCLQAIDAFLTWEHPIVSSYIRAETGQKKKGGKEDVIQTIANILGVNDVSQLNPNATLSDLGLDSLMGVEIKQAVERDYAIVLSMKDIRNLTLNKLKALCEGNAEVQLEPSNPDDEARRQQETEEIEAQLFSLFKLRIDVNDLLTHDPCAHLNDVTEGPPVFFVHSIEGIGSPLKTLASNMNFPVYCFQTTQSAPTDTIENLADFYIKTMKAKQPKGPYRLIGYSYGASIAFEMASQLQLENPKLVESLVLLDGSHAYMQAYRKVYRIAFGVKSTNLANDPLFESEILCALALRFAVFDYKPVRLELLQLPNWRARVNRIVDEVMPTGLFESRSTIEWGAESIRSKFMAADKYTPSKKFRGTMTLIRAQQGAAREEDVGNDYGLKEVTEGDVNVLVVPGDHDSFIQGENSEITADLISKLLTDNVEKSVREE